MSRRETSVATASRQVFAWELWRVMSGEGKMTLKGDKVLLGVVAAFWD